MANGSVVKPKYASPHGGEGERSLDHRQLAAYFQNLDKIIRGLLYVYVFSLPFKDLLFVERNGFIILLVLLGLWCIVNREHFFLRTPVDLPLAMLLAWVVLSLPFSEDPVYSLKEFGKLLQQALIFYVAVFFFRETTERHRLMVLLLAGMAIISVYGIWQFEAKPWSGYNLPTDREYFLIQSFLSAEVWLTTYLVMIIPLSAALAVTSEVLWQQVSGAALAATAVTCQFLTFSRAGLLALMVEAVVFVALAGKRSARVIAIGLATTVLIAEIGLIVVHHTSGITFTVGDKKFTAYNLEARLKVWNLGLEMVMRHPLVGIGYGMENFAKVVKAEPAFVDAQREAVIMPDGLHNTVLNLAVGAGIPAGFAYVWLMWRLAWYGIKRFRTESEGDSKYWSLVLTMMVVGLFTRNLFDHMWIVTMAELFWVVVALSLGPVALSVPAVQQRAAEGNAGQSG